MSEKNEISKPILVAQDGSAAAQAAADMAIQLARVQHLALRGMYVLDERLVTDQYANYQAELGGVEVSGARKDVVAALQAQGEVALRWLSARCHAEGVSATTDLVFGAVSDLVLQQAEQAQIIALGRRGRGHAEDHDYLGRNFQAIIKDAPRPLLIGGTDNEQALRRVLLAYNGGEHAQDALNWAAQLQTNFRGDFIVLVVREDSEQPQQWLSDLQSKVVQSGLKNFRFIDREGQPATAITTVAADNKVDLIVMGGHYHIPLLEWIVGSTLDRVLHGTELPILVA
jgi:nucleotide-binding universal stress UspA family protein